MARADASRPLVVPVVAGVIAGLILGLAGGYWLGSRNAPPTSAPAAQAVTPARPAPEASRPAAVPPAAPLAASPPPSAPAPAAPQAPAASPAAPPTAPRSVLTVLIESTPPGARIRIDGRSLGPTPLTVRQLRPGAHTLELQMPGFRLWSQRLTVAAGDRRRVMATLEREPTR